MGNLSLGAFAFSLAGMVGVFLVLAGLCHLIPFLSKPEQTAEKNAAPKKTVSIPRPAAPAVSASAAGAVALVDVDDKTAACIMAIVSHETSIPLSNLIFKTIKAI